MNYTAVIIDGDNIKQESFHYKSDAVAAARAGVNKGARAYVRAERTGHVTYILHEKHSACSQCGKELEGKTECSHCRATHSYFK